MKKIVLVFVFLVFGLRELSITQDDFEFDGYVKIRYVLSQGVPHAFSLRKIRFNNLWNVSNELRVLMNVDVVPESETVMQVRDLYIDWADIPDLGPSATGRLLLGKAYNHCFGVVPSPENRKTSDYGLVSSFLFRARKVGVQYFLDYDRIRVNFGLFNGTHIDEMTFGTEGSLLVYDGLVSENNKNKQGCVKFAIDTGEKTEFSFSVCSERFSSQEIQNLNIIMNTDFTNQNSSAYGADLKFREEEYVLSGGVYSISMSGMESNIYQILGEVDSGKYSYYLRIGYITYSGLERHRDFTATWDKFQLSPCFVYNISKKVWLQVEANLNGELEPQGADSLDNSELFTELHVGF